MNASAISASVTTRLNEIVGAANVASDFAQLAAYEIDRKLPAAAVRPATSEEAAEIVKFAAAENLSLVATGARTKLGIGYAPTRYDLALDMTRLNKVIAYDPGDLTLSVEAGVPLAKLAQASRRTSSILAAGCFPSQSAPQSAAQSRPALTPRCASFTAPRAIFCSAWNLSLAKGSRRKAADAW